MATDASRATLRKLGKALGLLEANPQLLRKNKDALVEMLTDADDNVDWGSLSEEEANEMLEEAKGSGGGAKKASSGGRGRKASTSGRGRGRKKAEEPAEEEETSDDEGDDEPEEKPARGRGRGRSRTKKTEEPAEEKPARGRGRGRGRKKAEEEPAAEEEAPKRGRGRSRTKKAEEPAEEPAAAATVDLTPIIERLDTLGNTVAGAKELKATDKKVSDLSDRLDEIELKVDTILFTTWELNYSEDFAEYEDFLADYCKKD